MLAQHTIAPAAGITPPSASNLSSRVLDRLARVTARKVEKQNNAIPGRIIANASIGDTDVARTELRIAVLVRSGIRLCYQKFLLRERVC